MAKKSIVIIGAGLASAALVRAIRMLDTECSITVICQCSGDQYYKPRFSTGLGGKLRPADHIQQTAGDWRRSTDITLVNDTVVESLAPSEKTISTSSGTFSFDSLVLAIGATPTPLPDEATLGKYTENVNSWKSYRDFIERLKASAHSPIIFGGGLVGCEMASDLATAGWRPLVVGSHDQLMPRLLPPAMSDFIKNKLVQAGVRFAVREDITEYSESDEQLQFAFRDGTTFRTDTVLNATGLSVRSEWLEAARIRVRKGILADAYLRTSVDDVYAIGDCAEIEGQVHQYIAPITASARALARTLCEQQTQFQAGSYPIQIKLQQSMTELYTREVPDRWSVENVGEGAVAKAFNSERFCGYAVSGDGMRQRNDLVSELLASPQ
jgi:rubredoxin-NAD+ reductase